MSDSSSVSRLVGRSGLEAHLREPDDDSCDNLGCFGYLRGVRDRAVMLELRKRKGNIVAVGYAWIERLEFDPSDGIQIHVGGKRVNIRGRNLNGPSTSLARLFDGLTRQRVPWIAESAEARFQGTLESKCVVEGIEW